MTRPTTGTIYGLVDPRTYEIMYVGQTIKPIEARLAGHLAHPAPRVRAWIESLAVQGAAPEVIPLRELVPVADLSLAEFQEIKVHAAHGRLLNTAGNEVGNAQRRKISTAEAKKRKAEEEAVEERWRQATWRKVADQIREATGGPISPSDVPVHVIPDWVWSVYLAYHAANDFLATFSPAQILQADAALARSAGIEPRERTPEETAAQRSRWRNGEALDRYVSTYCGMFSWANQGDRRDSETKILSRGHDAYKKSFESATAMARYLSFIPWAARAMDPWVALAARAGLERKTPQFVEWVTDDEATREAINLYRESAPGRLGTFRQSWDFELSEYMLALGAAHIPGFVTPELLVPTLKSQLTKLARQGQATVQMCQLLQRLDPKALDSVYGPDTLAAADRELGLPPGTAAQVIRRVLPDKYGQVANETEKLLQRHTGNLAAAAIPDYSDWTGPDVPGCRAVAASFCKADLFPDAGPAGPTLIEEVVATWKPTKYGREALQELESRVAATTATNT